MYLRILLLTLCLVFGASAQSGEQTPANKEAVGLGAGALIGGLIGGPPGAILGALGGAWFGNRDARNSESIGALESELNGRDEALAQLRAELAQVDRPTRDVIVATRHTGAETLPNGLSFNVHFRTASASVRGDVGGYLVRLARFLSAVPAMDVHLSGHADARGNEDYNQQLSEARVDTVQTVLEDNGLTADRIHRHAYGESQARASVGDVDAYAFDRKVNVMLSLDDEV